MTGGGAKAWKWHVAGQDQLDLCVGNGLSQNTTYFPEAICITFPLERWAWSPGLSQSMVSSVTAPRPHATMCRGSGEKSEARESCSLSKEPPACSPVPGPLGGCLWGYCCLSVAWRQVCGDEAGTLCSGAGETLSEASIGGWRTWVPTETPKEMWGPAKCEGCALQACCPRVLAWPGAAWPGYTGDFLWPCSAPGKHTVAHLRRPTGPLAE